MTWKYKEELAKRDYKDKHERAAFGAGYSDGYYGYKKNTSCEEHYYPNAYNAGYWTGKGDRAEVPINVRNSL